MAIKDWFVRKKEIVDNYMPDIGFPKSSTSIVEEQFKGQVEKKDIKFPKELGEEHPFDFSQLEELYKKFGFFTAVVDKYVDFIVGPGFYIECEDERAKTLIEQFMIDVNFDTLLRAWCREALVKGNGFLEIGGNPKKGIEGLKVLNANYMYVVRDKLGVVEGYNQYTGSFDKFAKTKVIPFKTYEIAHIPFNKIGDSAYGLGIGYPTLKDVDNILSMEKDLHWVAKRKANAPIHAQLGYISGDTKIIPKAADVTAFGQKLENLSNKTEWSTDILTNFKVIDYGNVGDRFTSILEHDMAKLFYDFQIPPELMGMANIPEGMATVRIDAFQRRIQSIQAELEKVIEENIFKRVLEANGFVKNSKGTQIHVEFEWGVPSTIAVQGRINLIADMLKSPTISPVMSQMLEEEMIKLLKLDESEYEELKNSEEELERELERQQPLVPGQNAKFPQKVAPKAEQPKQPKPQEILDSKKKKKKGIKKKENYEYEKPCPHCTEAFEEINDVSEWLGFKYNQYLSHIQKAVEVYPFDEIRAITEAEHDAGYLSDEQIEKLRDILDTGFTKGQGMREMAKRVDKIGLKDLYRMDNEGNVKMGVSGFPILAKSAEKRSIGIVRSEVTRLANLGAENYYKENGIVKERWVASVSDRTCPECEALNGQIFEIYNHPEIPLHPNCRCTLSPISELK